MTRPSIICSVRDARYCVKASKASTASVFPQRAGEWHSFDRLDPLGMWLGIAADTHELVTRHYDPSNPTSTASLGTLSRAAIQAISTTVMDESFVQSFVRLTDALSRESAPSSDKVWQQLIASNVGKFVPFSGALRSAAEATDSTERSTNGDGWLSIWDTLKSGLPGLSETDVPRRDVLGRVVQRPEGANYWWNPFAGAKPSDSHMDTELAKLAINVKVAPKELDGIALDAKQADEYTRLSVSAPIFGGLTLPEYMEKLTGSEEWKQLGTTGDHGVLARTKLVQRAVDEAYMVGKLRFEQAHPQFRQALLNAYIERQEKLTPGAGAPEVTAQAAQ